MRFCSTLLVVSLWAARAGAGGGSEELVRPPKPSFWKTGPAGGAFGLFVEGGGTAGSFGGTAFGAGSLGLGVSLRWFEASFTGYYASSFDSEYSAGAFLGRAALRVPVKWAAFSLGSEFGYMAVPGHYIAGLLLEPVSVGGEIDPVCHLRVGLIGAFGLTNATFANGVFRAALTVGYVMGGCSKP